MLNIHSPFLRRLGYLVCQLRIILAVSINIGTYDLMVGVLYWQYKAVWDDVSLQEKVPQTTDRPPRLTPSYISGMLQHSCAWIPTNGAHNNNNNNNFLSNGTRPPIEWIRVSWHGLYLPAATTKSRERYELIKARERERKCYSEMRIGWPRHRPGCI